MLNANMGKPPTAAKVDANWWGFVQKSLIESHEENRSTPMPAAIPMKIVAMAIPDRFGQQESDR